MFRDVNSQTFGWRTGVTRGRGDVFQQGNDDSLVAVRLGGAWDLPMGPIPVLARLQQRLIELGLSAMGARRSAAPAFLRVSPPSTL
jgi:hypothetical protein